MAEYLTQFSCLLDVGSAENAAKALDLYTGGTTLWMRSEGSGDPEALIQFVKCCARAFGLTGRWGFQYANTCSRLRPDAFGGGAHVLDLATGETVDWIDSDGWLAATLAGGVDHA